jgi:hypothetical protein
MWRRICLIAIGVATICGGILVGGFPRPVDVSWNELRLEVVKDQLADLKALLLAYKASHGAYPSNDDGLAALDGYSDRFVVGLRKQPGSDSTAFSRNGYYRTKPGWSADRLALAKYRQEHGHGPRSEAELFQAILGNPLQGDGTSHIGTSYMPIPVEVGIGPGDCLLVLCPAGIMTPWLVPYVYENRTGTDPTAFQDSPANSGDPRWSICVDDGVYVYSLGAKAYAAEYDSAFWPETGLLYLGCALLAGGFVGLILVIVSRRKSVVGSLFVGMLLFGVYTFFSFGLGTLANFNRQPEPDLFGHCEPKAIAEQRTLLKEFHKRGILGDEAYEKALMGLEKGI